MLKCKFFVWLDWFGDDYMIDLLVFGVISDIVMMCMIEIEMMVNGLLNMFVLGCNLMFMMIVVVIVYWCGLCVLVGGMCEIDFLGYLDCCDDMMKVL